jgi:glucose/mannose-6-phosphate isomerase
MGAEEGMGEAMDLGLDLVRALDRGDMLGAIASLAEQMATTYPTACERLDGVFAESGAGRSAPPSKPTGLVICGMGGSAIGADLVLASLPDLPVPATVVRGYELPGWVSPQTLVVAVSYSGDTEETLACLEAALERGCVPVCVSSGGRLATLAGDHGLPLVLIPGGQQPRVSLGYLSVPLLAVIEAAGLCGAQGAHVDETVELLRRGNLDLGPDAPEMSGASGLGSASPRRVTAKGLARLLHGRQALVYGAASTVAVARRWKGQINENAKAPAFWNELPELDHNELMGWTSLPGMASGTLAVFVNDEQTDARLLRRADLTAAVLAERGVAVEQVWAQGDSRLARLFSLVQLGDYASFYLALLYGVDPTPVAAIQDFKAKLAGGAGV